MRRDRPVRAAVALVAAAVVATAAGCTVPVHSSSTAPSTESSTVRSSLPVGTGPVVTVPGIGGPTAPPTSMAESSDVPTSAAPTTVADLPASPSSSPSPLSETSAEPSTTPPAPTSAPAPPPAPVVTGRTAQVDLSSTCPECSVISSRAEVVDDLAMAVVSMPGGRTAAMALRPDGSTASILAVPYGVTFPTPTAGILPCDNGGHCLIEATTGDGGVVTALGLGSDGQLTDLSPPDGFVSVGVPARIVDLDGQPGVAVLEVPGTEPVWTVYGWAGDAYAPVGCATGSTPNLADLSLSRCG